MLWGAALALLLAAGDAPAVAGDHCSVGLRNNPDVIALPRFDLLHADPDRPLPAMSTSVLIVTCARASVIPGPADWRVLRDWHAPLVLVVGDRTEILEAPGGHLGVRFLEGRLDPSEEPAMTAWLNGAQSKLQEPAPGS